MVPKEFGSKKNKSKYYRVSQKIGKSHGNSCYRIDRRTILHLTKRSLESTKRKD